ncbi:response regulator transcription factor [Streptomyces sp. NPDC001940]|uniref:response regulator transcription factor n=1 Tax=Streptomyces sp. NBC_00401 TaxID=2975738 RepID=UPI00224CD6F0|nr:response regulator transcription factor [Streptomyces sp. NBC_00401]MCX5079482.1 response regulator transcription factor [Streptomyces sp. NBC_00401]
MTIPVLLADDHALLRDTFRILINSADDLEVVGQASDGAEAITLAETLHPDIVIMDIRMPGTDGLAATTAICGDPSLSDVRILILTTFETDEYVARALRAGASGFLGKDVTADVLLDAIRTVADGDALLSPASTKMLVSRFLVTPEPASDTELPDQISSITAREREVMIMAARGMSNTDIADTLCLSPLTVRSHIQRAMTKLHARGRAQLVVAAYQSGLVQSGPPATP